MAEWTTIHVVLLHPRCHKACIERAVLAHMQVASHEGSVLCPALNIHKHLLSAQIIYSSTCNLPILSSYLAPRVVESSNEHPVACCTSTTCPKQQYHTSHRHHVRRKSAPQPSSIHRQSTASHRETKWPSRRTTRASPAIPTGSARLEHDPWQACDSRICFT